MQQTTNQSKTKKSHSFSKEKQIPNLTFEQTLFERIITLNELQTLISSKYGDVCEQTIQNIDQHCNRKTTESDDMSAIDKGIEHMLSAVGVDGVKRLDKIIRRLSDCSTTEGDANPTDYIKLLYVTKFTFFEYTFNTLLESRNSRTKQLINAKLAKGGGLEKLFRFLLPIVPSYDTDFVDLGPLEVHLNRVFDVFSNSSVKSN